LFFGRPLLLAGILLLTTGLVGSFLAQRAWGNRSFGPVDPVKMLRLAIPAVGTIVLGCQIILSSFFLSLLGLERK
jgi:hypothetical protein